MKCPCGSAASYEDCCEPLIKGSTHAVTAEQLMRSRYSAYAMKEIAYLKASLHPDHRSDFNEDTTRAWADRAEWHSLEILRTAGGGNDESNGEVEFIATYTDNGIKKEHHELASFKKEAGSWYLVDGKVLPPRQVVRAAPKIGRNDPCPCGSGKKHKKCCAIPSRLS